MNTPKTSFRFMRIIFQYYEELDTLSLLPQEYFGLYQKSVDSQNLHSELSVVETERYERIFLCESFSK